ncbi:MAG: hypothetical protein R2867_10835 [Caldilineaceae bacterium]
MAHHTMTHQTLNQQERSKILDQVHEGMTVYDNDRNDIGSVAAIYYGAVGDEDAATGTVPATTSPAANPTDNSFVEDLVEAFDPRDQVPEELAERLRYSGYIKIDGGWFGADRYIMPNQVAAVSDEGVYLSTNRERLIQD